MGLMPQTKQIAENFIRLLPLVYNKMNKPVTKHTPVPKPSDLTHLQFHILEELFHAQEGIAMTHLAQSISISKQQLTPLIKKLEEKEYVKKVQDANDRRFVKLMLTEKGKRTVYQRWEEFYRLFCDRISQLGEDDLFDLDYAIHKIIRILGKL
ncbi:MarR family transcriptional regulator [Brevibacillus sp. LEMMJ03]|nr:MarR family transcriptional regulator [Brevibacillus sp. LEMMJ03]